MAGTKVRVLYDFEGDPSGNELSVNEGDVLTITNQDVGDGWWEGELSDGRIGLFPEAYVETISDGAGPSAPPAAAAESYQSNGYQGYNDEGSFDEDEDDDRGRSNSFDESWDNETAPAAAAAVPAISISTPQNDSGAAWDGGDSSTISRNRSESISRSGTIRKNINRFSTFVKSGGEDYLLGNIGKKAHVTDTDQISLQETHIGPQWVPSPNPYTLTCTEPTKRSKFKGVKSFIAYRITPTSTNFPVERRYKHFDWLHDRLMEKFTLLSVPPLPDKQYAGRYGEDFVEKRRERLEKWLNRVARHPVLARSDVFLHFLTCKTTEEKQWKAGKRRAEKDELIGSAFYMTVTMPTTIQVVNSEADVERFGKFVRSMDENTLKLKERCQEHCEKSSGIFKREYQKLGQTITRIGETFATEEKDYARGITEAFSQTGKMYDEIGALYEEQPKNDMLPLLDVLREYLGMLSTYPDMVDVHKEATAKVTQCKKLVEEDKMPKSDSDEIEQRADVLSAVTMAEINHFHSERVIDMKDCMTAFLQSQIKFHQEIIERLQLAVGMCEQV